MSCYLHRFADLLKEAGIEVTKENKKQLDQIIHQLVEVEYKNCSLTGGKLKEIINSDKKQAFIAQLKDKASTL